MPTSCDVSPEAKFSTAPTGTLGPPYAGASGIVVTPARPPAPAHEIGVAVAG
jgi:hypothetical protein